MDMKTLRLMTEYNSITNSEMNGLIGNISDEQWNFKFSGYYPSIHSLCNHIYISDFTWMKRFSNIRAFDFLEDEVFRNAYDFSSTVFTGQDEYISGRNRLDSKFSEFVSEAEEDDFRKTLVFTTFSGAEQKRNFGGILHHIFNHQTHHRGMISVYLDSLGIKNDYSNLMYLIEP